MLNNVSRKNRIFSAEKFDFFLKKAIIRALSKTKKMQTDRRKNKMNSYVARVLDRLHNQRSWQTEFIQSVSEVYSSLDKLLDSQPKYEKYSILERLMIPERIIAFQVPWVDDRGEIQVNAAFRVQFNSAIGPYKGGLRFHPAVTPSMLKFLGFEQTFKNALTTLPMGGGKGGSDFNPVGKSDAEIMRF